MKPIVPIAVVVFVTGAALAAIAREPASASQVKTPPGRKPPSPTYPAPAAQNVDPAAEQVVKQYETAFNQQDAKAIAALYADNAARLTPTNQVLMGRTAIEGFYVSSFAGTKPPALTLRPGRTQMVTPDMAVTEGTFEAAGTTVTKGIYVVTLVRQNGQWKIASAVPVPDAR